MIKSAAFQAQTTSGQLLRAKTGRTHVSVQNHDAANAVVVSIAAGDAILSPPNGVNIKAGEYLEIKGDDLNGEVTIISAVDAVDCTVLYN